MLLICEANGVIISLFTHTFKMSFFFCIKIRVNKEQQSINNCLLNCKILNLYGDAFDVLYAHQRSDAIRVRLQMAKQIANEVRCLCVCYRLMID